MSFSHRMRKKKIHHRLLIADVGSSSFVIVKTLLKLYFLTNFLKCVFSCTEPSFCMLAFSSCHEQGATLVVVAGLLTAVASLVAACRL